MATTVTNVLDVGNDAILITGRVDWEEQPVEARGWKSALDRFYPSSAYDGGTGHRDDSTPSEARTGDQKVIFCKGLLEEQNPNEDVTASARDLSISG
jgi:hypothetical protein